MSSFSVNPEQLEALAAEIQNLNGRLQSELSELSAVRSRVRAINSLSNKGYGEIVGRLSERLSSISSEVGQLSSKLDRISAIYQQYERQVLEKSGRIPAGISAGLASAAAALAASGATRDEIRQMLSQMPQNGMAQYCSYSADPVNLTNGNYVYENNFFHYDTPVSINLRIFYNIQNRKIGAIGKGWTTSYEKRLVLKSDHAWVSMEDDSRKEFYVTESGIFLPLYAGPETLAKDGENYVYKDGARVCHVFDASGKIVRSYEEDKTYEITYRYETDRLLSVSDSCGNSFEIRYTADEKIEMIRDAAGRAVYFSYDGDRLLSVTDPEGSRTAFQYNGEDRLSAVIGPDGVTVLRNAFDGQGRTTEQTFADGGSVKYSYQDEARRVTMTQQNGTDIIYEHDEAGRHTATIFPDGTERSEYNDDNRKTAAIDARGNRTAFEYDGRGEVAKVTNPLGDSMTFARTDAGQVKEVRLNGQVLQTAEYDELHHQVRSTDANGGTVSFEYDEWGNVSACTYEDGSRSEFTYNKEGELLRVVTPGRGSFTYEYDICHRIAASTDALGNRTEYAYDRNDRIVCVTNAEGRKQTYEYDGSGNLVNVTDFAGGVTKITYNSMNQVESYTDPDGSRTSFEYDTMWNMTARTAPDGGVTRYGYDGRERLISITDANGGCQTAEYDACGNLVHRTAEDGAEYFAEYDALNRPVRITEPSGAVRTAAYDAQSNIVELGYDGGIRESGTYDLMGNLTSYTDKTGYTRYFRYTAAGDTEEISDETGWITRFEYYPGGLLRREMHVDGSWQEFSYDAAGNLVKIADQAGGGWSFKYDALGRVVCAEHADDRTETYEYDALGNITAVTDGDGGRTEYRYSGAGDLLSVKDALGHETGYLYDACHRLTHVLMPEDGVLTPERINRFNESQSGLRVMSMKYDLTGRAVCRKNADGAEAHLSYDACGRLSSITDEDGNEITLSYYPDGKRKQVTIPDAGSIIYQYNALRQLVEIEDWQGKMRFRQDPEDRLLEVTDQKGRTVSYDWSGAGQLMKITYPDGKAAAYGYDDFRRISSVTYEDESFSLSYGDDARLCRRTTDRGGVSEYAFNRAGLPTLVRHAMNGTLLEEFRCEYDAAGRQSRMTRTSAGDGMGGSFEYAYDPLGMLRSVKKDGQDIARYEYDVFGNRIAGEEAGSRAAYEYGRMNQLLRVNSERGTETRRYDGRGNLLGIASGGTERMTFTYDAFNHMTGAKGEGGEAVYGYNGLYMRTFAEFSADGRTVREDYVYDCTRAANHLLARIAEGAGENLVWCDDLLCADKNGERSFFFPDVRMSPSALMGPDGSVRHAGYMPFGAMEGTGWDSDFGFIGYRRDPVTGFYHANQREYDDRSGRFTSMDSVASLITMPLAFNAYLYCMNDPVNLYDPTGLIWAWLAGGIVGGVVKAGAKLAGDVVKTVVTGKNQFSSPQSYIGAFAGGFVQGSTYVAVGMASGGNLKLASTIAGAAGNATETLVTNGLSMATHAKGYENYTWKNLALDTAVSTVEGAAEGFAWGNIAKDIKIEGINKGKGSFQAVWKQVMTKGAKGTIQNVTWKTVSKGLLGYGLLGTADKIWQETKKETWEIVKTAIRDSYTPMQALPGTGGAPSGMMMLASPTAACPATGSSGGVPVMA